MWGLSHYCLTVVSAGLAGLQYAVHFRTDGKLQGQLESKARALQNRWELVHTQTRPCWWIVQVTAKSETVRLQAEVQMNITMQTLSRTWNPAQQAALLP